MSINTLYIHLVLLGYFYFRIKTKFDELLGFSLCFTIFSIIFDQQCHKSKILETHANVSIETPHLPRETWYLLRGICIFEPDNTSPVVNDGIFRMRVRRLRWETRHLQREMWVHIQNLGCVTPLRFAELLPDSGCFLCYETCAEPSFCGSGSFVEPRKTFGKT